MRNDQIFTPKPIVEKMLDMVGYAGENIRTKTIFEPSFGDGAFLTSIVQRAINFYKENNLTERGFIEILDRIYGIEIDKKYFDKTSPFVSSLKNCRDSFVHSCKMPSDRFVRDIRAYLEVTNLQYLSVISGLSLEDISLIGAIVNSL